MANKINLESMSVAELQQLAKDVEKAIDQKKNHEAKTTLEEVKALVTSRGFDLDELMQLAAAKRNGGPGAKKVLGKAPVKYRDPSNPENVWSGRGKLPGWMVKAMEGGKKSKEDFLIKT